MVRAVVIISIIGIALAVISGLEIITANSSEAFTLLRAARILFGI
jgi:hypothetical protein